MVIDYCNLNNQIVKNNYLLPLITELIDNIGSKKVFTKMNLRQRFNNMRISKREQTDNGETKRRLWQINKDTRAEYNFDEQPWLQLMCCTLVSSHEVGHLFWNKRKLSEQKSQGYKIETGVDRDKIRTK